MYLVSINYLALCQVLVIQNLGQVLMGFTGPCEAYKHVEKGELPMWGWGTETSLCLSPNFSVNLQLLRKNRFKNLKRCMWGMGDSLTDTVINIYQGGLRKKI